jgi:hypothetical protein
MRTATLARDDRRDAAGPSVGEKVQFVRAFQGDPELYNDREMAFVDDLYRRRIQRLSEKQSVWLDRLYRRVVPSKSSSPQSGLA